MYGHFNKSYHKKTYNRFNGNQNRGVKRIKTFNPTDFITGFQASETEKSQDYLVTHTFSDFQIADSIKRNITEKGYQTPTPIQDQAIEPILLGKDLVGIANTGTGKTAAFLIPLIQKVLTDPTAKILILTPTRELAAQIRSEFLGFSKGLNIFACLCIGGENIKSQILSLAKNPSFIIATPGRILDLIRSNKVNLSHFSTVVLDEADRMVDIGFIKDIQFIVSLLPKNRQSLFFSATIGEEVRQILQSFVQNPVTVSVKTGETTENIIQGTVTVSDRSKKIDLLHDLLIQEGFVKVLVFGRTKHSVQKLSDDLVTRGFKAGAIHGNKRQSQRAKTLELFKKDEIKILIATDVASRGLDIPNVSHVINYDMPESKDAYIHRIGRTGRADKKGVAITFIG